MRSNRRIAGQSNQRLICNMGRRALTLAKEMDAIVCDAASLARRTARSLWGFRNRLMQTSLTDDARAGCRGSLIISQTVCASARRRSMRRMWPGISNSSCVFQENIMFRACGRVRCVQEIRDADGTSTYDGNFHGDAIDLLSSRNRWCQMARVMSPHRMWLWLCA